MAEGKCPDRLLPFQWKPGQSGNPKGRAKKKTFEQLVEDLLDTATVELEGESINCRDAVAGRLIELLLIGDRAAMTAYLDRVWPKILKHEVDLPGADAAALADRLSGHATRKRSNGADRSDDDSREAGA